MSQSAGPAESRAFIKALSEVRGDAPTACAEWTAHDLVAHLAAGAQEIAELIEDAIAGRPPRPTRSFEEREAPFAALPDDELRQAMADMTRRKVAATQALSGLGTQAIIEFTGRPFTAEQLERHGRSEAALHRWDLVGDDGEGDALLAQPEMTRHAVDALNTLPVLAEAPATRAAQAGLHDARIVLRSPDRPDVVLVASAGTARFELVTDPPVDANAIVTTDSVNRLLTIWGRRSSRRQITISADPDLWSTVARTLWPAAVRWPNGHE